MAKDTTEFDIYHIPPNFIEGSTVMGGLFKLRNLLEAGILVLTIGIPICTVKLDLAAKVMLLCLTTLPLAMLALMGISGESLFSYLSGFFSFLFRRRVIGDNPHPDPPSSLS